MRIRVQGYLNLRGVIGDLSSRQIAAETITVRELARELAVELGGDFARMVSDLERGRHQPHMAILVNGCHCSHLPAGLDTELHDGDELAIFPPAMGG